MGALQNSDYNQECKKKLLSKKPTEDSRYTQVVTSSEQIFTNEVFGEEARLDTSWEEDLWRAATPAQELVDNGPVTDQEPSDQVYYVDVEVNNNSSIPGEAVIIVENNKELWENPADFWGLESFNSSSMHHAPAALVEGLNHDEVDQIYNMDIVQFAIGESGIDGLVDPTFSQQLANTTVPVASTESFIHLEDNLISMNGQEISHLSPKSTSVFAKKSSPFALQSQTMLKKKVGRPERTTPIKISGVKGYRRMRDLNNEASKKCRKNRKEKQTLMEQECAAMEERNRILVEELLTRKSLLSAWKAKCQSIGCKI